MKRLLLLIASYFLFTGNSHAIEFTYKFKVLSSGPDMYACNVGLRHPEGSKCFIDGTTTPCSDGKCYPGAPCVNRCKCLGPAGDTRVDRIEGVFGTWTDNPDRPTRYTENLRVWGATSWVQQFPDNMAWNYKLGDDLVFKFTSEEMGAEYFVDICYRGPQDITFDGTDGGVYALSASTYGNDSMGRMFPDGRTARYIALADLASSVDVQCTNRPRRFSPMLSAGDQFMGAQRINFFRNENVGDLLNIPRFCKIRYYFKETSRIQRPNTLQEAHMCTWTRIDEPRIRR